MLFGKRSDLRIIVAVPCGGWEPGWPDDIDEIESHRSNYYSKYGVQLP